MDRCGGGSWVETMIDRGPLELRDIAPRGPAGCALALPAYGAVRAYRRRQLEMEGGDAHYSSCVGCGTTIGPADATLFEAHFCAPCWQRADEHGVCDCCWGVLAADGRCLLGNAHLAGTRTTGGKQC